MPLGSAYSAQPSGITSDQDRLELVDGETSSVRFAAGAEIGMVVGTGLFDFGDVDGEGDPVRLRHPIGIAGGEAGLSIVDSYNSEPSGLGVWSRKMWVADTDDHLVRVVELVGRTVNTCGSKGAVANLWSRVADSRFDFA